MFYLIRIKVFLRTQNDINHFSNPGHNRTLLTPQAPAKD
jgi:hypothetical protein